MSQVSCHITMSHEKYGKIVHRLCSSCISSVQEINKDSIKFFLLTQTWSRFKLPWLEPYTCQHLISSHPVTRGLVKVFSEVISKVRVSRLLVILYKVVLGLKRVWDFKSKSFYTRITEKENLLFSFFFFFFFKSIIYYMRCVGRPWQYKKKEDYGPLGHVVNASTILTKHEAKKYSYK